MRDTRGASVFGVWLLAACAACGGGSVGPEVTPPDTTPLDGRGGGVIAYSKQPASGSGLHEIFAINADGTGDTRLVQAPVGLNHHDWSPDARRLAATGYVDATTASIYRFNADGTGLVRLTNEAGVRDSEPVWSPDGTRIVFSRTYPSQGDRHEIWIMDADGSGQRPIGVEGVAPKWSPNGDSFVYDSNQTGNWDLYTCNVDGTGVSRLTSTTYNEMIPAWSPSGDRLAYSSDEDGDFEVFVMNADGTDPRQLTRNTVGDFTPKWSPNGSLIAFSSDVSGAAQWEVHIMNADGTQIRRVTRTTPPRTAINPAWKPSLGG